MHIAELRIANFRGVKSGFVRFDKHTALVGPNNCGKTTVAEALALLFGRDRLVKALTEHDFHGSQPGAEDRIALTAVLTGFPANRPENNAEWFRDGRGVERWLAPDGVLHAVKGGEDWQLAVEIGYSARFDLDTLTAESIRYFVDHERGADVFLQDIVAPIPQKLLAEVGFFLVPASRTWDRTMSFASELFRRVVQTIGGVPAATIRQERDRLRNPDQPLEGDEGLKRIVESVDDDLAALLGGEPKLSLRLTATDSEGVLDVVTPHYTLSGAPPLPARRQGTGLASLQTLLLLFQFARLRQDEGKSFILVLEEPELHVPPALQRRIVHRLRQRCGQSIVSTHSPSVATFYDPSELALLENSRGELSAAPLASTPLTRTAPNSLRKLFGLRRGEVVSALMHETVLVPEGETDHELLGMLLRAAETSDTATADIAAAFGTAVGVVPTHDASVVLTFKTLAACHPRVAAVVDGDAAGKGYARELAALPRPPAAVIRWPDGWAVEDIVAWLAEKDWEKVKAALAELPDGPPADATGLRNILLSKPKDGGIKTDSLAYRTVVEALMVSSEVMSDAARLLLEVAATLRSSEAAASFAKDEDLSTARTSVFVFTPWR